MAGENPAQAFITSIIEDLKASDDATEKEAAASLIAIVALINATEAKIEKAPTLGHASGVMRATKA